MIPVIRRAGGVFDNDFTKMQRYIDICAKHHIDREISLYGLCGVWSGDAEHGLQKRCAPDDPELIRVRYFDERDGLYKYMDSAADIGLYIAALERYFTESGQIDKVRIVADEPTDTEAYRRSLARLRAAAPGFRSKAALNNTEFIDEFRDEVFDFVPYIHTFCRRHGELTEYKNSMPNKRFLFYICCGPEFPNTFLYSDLVESLFLVVFASYSGSCGLLRWSYTAWNDDPRHNVLYAHWHAGDAFLVYPSANGAPLLSLRYKALKRGIQLYELLELLRDTGDADALDYAYSLVQRERDIAKYASAAAFDGLASPDDRDYTALKRYIAERLG